MTPVSSLPSVVATPAQPAASGSILVCLGSSYLDTSTDQLDPLLDRLYEAFGEASTPPTVAYPASQAESHNSNNHGFRVETFTQQVPSHAVSYQPAAAWIGAYEVLRAGSFAACLLLGEEAQSMPAQSMRSLIAAVASGADLAVPRYRLEPTQGLLNASILSPVSRALFGISVRFPLPLDCAVSPRMAERMATAGQRQMAARNADGIVWPVAEAAAAGYSVEEEDGGRRQPPGHAGDLSEVLNMVAGSLFSDIESKAAYWQRVRPVSPVADSAGTVAVELPPLNGEIEDLVHSFRLGYNNLQEIWSAVLPPNTLLGIKRLASAPIESFKMPDALWVRIVYDFVLAHRLRTITRGHLMGALTPLYLAWVASYLLAEHSGARNVLDRLAQAFEADKPYLVSRWRWPDRFNP